MITCQKKFSLTVNPGVPAPTEYWMMPESGNIDRVGAIHGLTLQSTGDPIINSCGAIGNGAFFQYSTSARKLTQGSGDWSLLPYNSANGYSLSFWVYVCYMPDNLFTSGFLEWDVIDGLFNIKGGFFIGLQTLDSGNSLTIALQGFRGNGALGAVVNKTTTMKAWHHIVCTYNPTSALFSFYVDAVLVGTQATVVPWPSLASANPTLNFGGVATGVFDELGVFTSHTLTQSEITTLYNSGKGSRPTEVNSALDPVSVPDCLPGCQLYPDLYWKFDTSSVVLGNLVWTDSMHSTPMAQFGGTLSQGAVGEIGGCATFGPAPSGGNSQIQASTVTYNAIAGISFSAWVNVPTYTVPMSGSDQWFFADNTNPGTSNNMINVKLDPNVPQMTLTVVVGGVVKTTVTVAYPSVNTWHNIVATYDKASGNVVLYLDGASVGTGNTASAFPTGVFHMTVLHGVQTIGTGQGTILFDELGVWENHVLSASEVSAIWNGGSGVRPPGVT